MIPALEEQVRVAHELSLFGERHSVAHGLHHLFERAVEQIVDVVSINHDIGLREQSTYCLQVTDPHIDRRYFYLTAIGELQQPSSQRVSLVAVQHVDDALP